MTPGLGVAAAQLVADASQGATEGEAEQAMILEVVSEMSMVVEGLMMVTDVAVDQMPRSSPWREKKEEKKEKKRRGRRRRRETTRRPPQPKQIGVREDEKKKNKTTMYFVLKVEEGGGIQKQRKRE